MDREFYPSVSNGAFESSYFTALRKRFGSESPFDQGPDGDEDNTDYENEDAIGGLTECSAPKYRTLVKQKKSELKGQYGKGHFGTKDCGQKPLPTETILNMICAWDCSKDKNKSKWCCEFNAGQAEKRVRNRKYLEDWNNCAAGANGIGWVPGWRSKWRDFKRNDGLAVLKAASKCESTGGSPLNPTTTPPQMTNPAIALINNMTCQQMKDTFNIIPGQSWGTAPKEVIASWSQRQCFETKVSDLNAMDQARAEEAAVAANSGLINKIINNKGIALTVGAIIVIVLITAVILMPTKKAA